MFDLEYGQPAASTTLPTSRPAFRDLLGCFGHADAGKSVLESGVDLLYTSHQVCVLACISTHPWQSGVAFLVLSLICTWRMDAM